MVGGSVARRASMREVAQLARVSVSTVANVLNNPTIVTTSTRERVEAAIARIGYVRSGPARQLRGAPSRLVGVISLDTSNPFYAAVSRGIEDRLDEEGYILLSCSTDVEPEREARALQVLEEHAVAGIIITPTEHNQDLLLAVSDRGTPVVLVDSPRGRLALCAATVDHYLGGQVVGEHLIELGHRRIVVFTGGARINPVVERHEGLRSAVVRAGLDPIEVLREAIIPPPNLDDGTQALIKAIVSQPAPPTAVVCLNDVAALGAMRALTDLGIRIPDDMSVVGYDDLPFAAQLYPPLTTVRRPTYRLGVTAAELLLDEATDGHDHREIRFQPSLVVRASTGEPRTGELVPAVTAATPTKGTPAVGRRTGETRLSPGTSSRITT
jgi:LacI family transcriptional regulator